MENDAVNETSYAVTTLSGPEDTETFKRLIALMGDVFEEPETYQGAVPGDDWLDAFLAGPANFVVVARHADEVVGGLVGYVLDKFEQRRREAYVYDLAVDGAHQRRGVGTRLMREALAVARARGCYHLFVQADDDDPDAIAFYQALRPDEDIVARHFGFNF